MPQNFPNSPSTGTVYTINNETWTYDGSGWDRSVLSTAIPGQTGNSGKYLTTNGTTISWSTLTSSQGTTGSQGIQGVGNVGTQGTAGSQGVTGSQGATGTSVQGTTGTATQGTTGSQGITGTGVQGTSGPSSITAINNQQNTGTGYIMIPNGTTAERPVSPYYGAMRYNTTTGLAEIYTVNGWGVFGAAPPTITTVSPGTYNGEQGTTFTINGNNFTSDAVVKFIDVNNTEYTAGLVTFVNSTQLTATTPQDFTVAQEPLDVKVSQISGTVTKLDCIDCGGSPSWTTTAGQIGGTIYRNGSVSTSVAATDPDSGATISYSVYSGALPTGLALTTSTGAITGTAPNVGSDTTYNFTLRVTDNAGNTADRAFSMIILQGSPGAPTIGTATRSASQSVQVTFTAPANAGGSSITSYTVTSSPGGLTGTGSTSPITVSGLTNGTAYTFTVTATNSYGTSSASSASNLATPYTVPGAPTVGTATSTGQNTATVAFTAPASDGGNTITSYTAVASPGGATGTLSQAGSGTITVSGLTAATAYTFTVYATNTAGNGSSSAASNSITTSPLSAPPTVEYLVLAGGGGGGTNHAGGGGAGGYYNSTLSVSESTSYTVTVGGSGAGGAGGSGNRGTSGSASQFASISTTGGGGGGGRGGGPGIAGGSGGGGGGGSGDEGYGGTTDASQGYRGGQAVDLYGAGGGGAGGQGGDRSGSSGGAGGSAAYSGITGTSTAYGGGGGGGGYTSGTATAGGSGIGGNGGDGNSGTPGSSAPSANTGSGGGGGGPAWGAGGNGSSGIVIIAYSTAYRPLTSISGGLSYDQPTRSGYRVYRFTGGTGPISW